MLTTVNDAAEMVLEGGDDHRWSALTWLLSVGATCTVGLSGILPLFVISPEMGLRLRQDGDTGGGILRPMLGFAVGALLGDVFLHLLPESVEVLKNSGGYSSDESALRACGVWTLVGLFTFVFVELLFSAHQRFKEEAELDDIKGSKKQDDAGADRTHPAADLSVLHRNGHLGLGRNGVAGAPLDTSSYSNSRKRANGIPTTRRTSVNKDLIHISGYLNLIANSIDNFSHGLAVAGSFLAGTKVGLVTTFAILLHEIPHEVGDFAILLKSGFSRWQAARAQLGTAAVGVLGAVAALSIERVDSLGRCTSWILPFTAGGFLNIALIGVLPELLKERDPRETVKQFLCVLLGLLLMAAVQQLTH